MKTKQCPDCKGIMNKSFDENSSPIWECRCCYKIFPRKIKISIEQKLKNEKMNNLINELLINN